MVENKQICGTCLREEPYLVTLITKNAGSYQQCDYCKTPKLTMSVKTLADNVNYLIQNFYCSVEYNQPFESNSSYGDSLYDILEDEVSENEEVINDLIDILSEIWFDHSSHQSIYGYEPYFSKSFPDTNDFFEKWYSAEESLCYSSRFFNNDVFNLFQDIFNYIRIKHEKSLLKYLPGEIKLYRARVFQSDNALIKALQYPEDNLGPPPPNVSSSGRMNAQGISVFYGSTEKDIAISEVRPPVGSYVVVAQFDLLRSINILDITLLSKVVPTISSLFDPNFIEEYKICKFINFLAKKMTIPVLPEMQNQNYILTQAISDFLSNSESIKLDGILFPSSQTSIKKNNNIILFNKSSHVENSKSRINAVRVNLYQDDETGGYFAPEITTCTNDLNSSESIEVKNKYNTLSLNLDEIEIFDITRVIYEKTESKVINHK